MPMDIVIVDAGALILLGLIVWYFRLFRRS